MRSYQKSEVYNPNPIKEIIEQGNPALIDDSNTTKNKI